MITSVLTFIYFVAEQHLHVIDSVVTSWWRLRIPQRKDIMMQWQVQVPASPDCSCRFQSRLWKTVQCAQEEKNQLLALPFFAGSRPVASRYLLIISSWVLGEHGWYLQYSIVYSPFPCRVGERTVKVRMLNVSQRLAAAHTLICEIRCNNHLRGRRQTLCSGETRQNHTSRVRALLFDASPRFPPQKCDNSAYNLKMPTVLAPTHSRAHRTRHETWNSKFYITHKLARFKFLPGAHNYRHIYY